MNEKEELMANINASAGVMKEIEKYENLLALYQQKRQKARGVGRFILVSFVATTLVELPMNIINNFFNIPVLVAFGLLLDLFAFIGVPIVLRSKLTKKYDKKIEECDSELVKLKNEPVLNWLPQTYRDSFSYVNISSYFRDMRANTLQEAINLFEVEKHQARLEAEVLLLNN